MEANRWYMCRYDYQLGGGVIFEGGEIYFFEPACYGISTIDEDGDTYYFTESNRSVFNDLFRLATNEEIHNPNQVLLKERDSDFQSKGFTSRDHLTKREMFAAMAMQGLLCNSYHYEVVAMQDASLKEITANDAVKIADELIKALNESRP